MCPLDSYVTLDVAVGGVNSKIDCNITLQTIDFVVFGNTFFVVFGNYAAYLELNGLIAVLSTLADAGAPLAIIQVLETLPWSTLVLIAFTLLCIIFAATSFDSASYTLAMVATKELGPDEHPDKWHRMFWACLISLLPITLIYMGGLKPLQSAVTLASIPLLIIFLLLISILALF